MFGSALLGSFYLASATAQTPGLPPPLPEAAQAVLYARSQIARSNATRSNYIRPNITVLLTKYRYPDPVEQVDLTAWTRMGTLNVTQAINDEPDTCSLTCKPELPAEHVPQVGDIVSVGIASEGYGPVAWAAMVKADGASHHWPLGEQSVWTAYDVIGDADAPLTGNVIRGDTTPFNDGSYATWFGGTDGRGETSADLTVPVHCTIEAWIRPSSVADNSAIFSTRFTANAVQVFVTPGVNGALTCYVEGVGQVSGPPVPLNIYSHVVVTHDGATCTFYINGVRHSAVAQARGVQSPHVAAIGANPGGSNFWHGSIDELAIYPKALTAAQVASHYAHRTTRAKRIAGGLEFAGPVVIKTHERRNENKSPWVAVQCQDWQWFFDAQLVNESWPTQSATTTILDLLARFVNYSVVTGALAQPFTADYVTPNMPACDAFVAINWRPSEVLRHLTNAIKGGFYIDPRRAVHAWADGPEANISDPQALTNHLWSLKSFRHTVDASQVRRKVTVEGMRARTLCDTPSMVTHYQNGIPVDEGRPFVNPAGVVGRMGTQLFDIKILHPLQATVENPFTAHVLGGMLVLGGELPPGVNHWLTVDSYPVFLGGGATGWIKVGEQFVYYVNAHYNPDPAYCPTPESRLIMLNHPGVPFGHTIAAIKTGETVTWLDWMDDWLAGSHTPGVTNDPIKPTLAGTEVVLAGIAVDPDAGQPWAANIPVIETLVSDARYSYAGALARATADVNFFRVPLLQAEWQTFDWNARPGRNQFINLTDTDPVTAQLTIQTVNVTFELRTLHPRRACRAGLVKPSTLLDILTTENA